MKFLSRKQIRKEKRIEKKKQKDFFYRKRSFERKLSNESNSRKRSLSFQKNDLKNKKISNLDNEEEIDSENVSENENENEKENNNKNNGNNKINNNTNNIYNELPNEYKEPYDTILDKEINFLEKKLGLKKENRYNRFKKKIAAEGYDEDIFEFLDNVEKEIKAEDYKSAETTNNTNNITNNNGKSKTNKTINDNKEAENTNIEKEPQIFPQSKLFSNIKLTKEEELKIELTKTITSYINKISEANLIITYNDFMKTLDSFKSTNKIILYETVTKICLRAIINQQILNLPITSCICSLISLLHYKYGNPFMLYFLNKAFEIVKIFKNKNDSFEINEKTSLKNLTFLMIHFYIFGNITSKIYYDIINFYIENFNEIFSENLLLLLTYIGIEMRKEDPERLKEIISNINKKYNLIKLSNKENTSKIKYIVDMIDDIKNNKYLKFNLSEKFNFFKNFVNNNKKQFMNNEYNINSVSISDKIDINLNTLLNVDVTKIDLKNEKNENFFNTENEIIDVEDQTDKNIEKILRKYKMTTDLKKTIFKSIVFSSDGSDAFEKLTRLNLNKEQSREIIKIIILLLSEEKSYNPFYKLLLEKLIDYNKSNKYTIHYTIWDNMKLMSDNQFKIKKIHNIAKLISDLLFEEKISLPVFLSYEFEDAHYNVRLFMLMCFDLYFEKIKNDIDKVKIMFAKLVKNDDHVEFAKRLFNFFVNDFKSEINFDNKSEEYFLVYSAAEKILKKIL